MENITNNLDKCPVCGKKKSSKFEACYLCRMATLNLENSKVNPNYSLENYNSVRIKDPQHIVEFVDRIEGRGGWCSINEMLVELITLYNENGVNVWGHSELPPHIQLMNMYSYLKKLKNKLVIQQVV